MAEQSAFERILSRLDESDGVTEKTAAAAPPSTEEALIKKVAELSTVKTASVSKPTPAESLETMAKEAAAQEDELLVKQAQHMGAVLADGFMERFAQYDTALRQQGVKTAAPVVDNAALTKAAEFGYAKAQEDMEKEAAEQYNKGYSDTMYSVHKIASEIHLAGQQVASQLIQEANAK
jgi:hypothetical protein